MISDYDALTHVTWWRHTITDSAVLVSNISTSTHIHFSLYLIHFESNKLTLFYAIHQTLSLNIPSKISHFFFERSYLLEEIQHQDCVLTSSLPRIYIFPFSKLTASGVNWSNGGKLRLNPVILTHSRNSAIPIESNIGQITKTKVEMLHRAAAIPTTGFSRPRARRVDILHSYNQLVDFTHHPTILQPARLSPAQEGLRITDFCFHKQSFDRRQVEGDWSRYGEISTG